MAFPVHDWQFWVATIAFVAAAALLVRGMVPVPWLRKRRKRSGHRATLTVGGKPVK